MRVQFIAAVLLCMWQAPTDVLLLLLLLLGCVRCRHGRATFSVLLFQDLAVVVLLMLIPLLAPDPSGASTGMAKIAQVRSRLRCAVPYTSWQ